MDYFDATYFDGSYFDTDSAAPPDSGGGGTLNKRRARIRVEPPAVIEEVTDDGWITILL